MKNFITLGSGTVILLAIFTMVFLSSCEKENIEIEGQTLIDNAEKGKLPDPCELNGDDLEIDVQWAPDCLSATVTLSLCCDNPVCSGCTIYSTLVEMRVETQPYVWEYHSTTILPISVRSGRCWTWETVVDYPIGGGSAALVDVKFNGQNIANNWDSIDAFCPFE